MALINCPECKRKVSDTVATCLQCGSPIAEYHNRKSAGVALTTVQETSKKLKSSILIAHLFFWIGLIIYIKSDFSTLNPFSQS